MISPITKTRDPLFDIDDTVPSGWGKMFVGGTHGQSQDWTSMLNRGFGVFALLVCSKCCKISSINNTTHSGRKRNTCHPKVACVRPLPMVCMPRETRHSLCEGLPRNAPDTEMSGRNRSEGRIQTDRQPLLFVAHAGCAPVARLHYSINRRAQKNVKLSL